MGEQFEVTIKVVRAQEEHPDTCIGCSLYGEYLCDKVADLGGCDGNIWKVVPA